MKREASSNCRRRGLWVILATAVLFLGGAGLLGFGWMRGARGWASWGVVAMVAAALALALYLAFVESSARRPSRAAERSPHPPRWLLAFALGGDVVGAVIAVVGLLSWSFEGLLAILGGLGLMVAGDLVLLARTRGHDLRPVGGPEGKRARVVRRLAPEGRVRIGSETWAARTVGGQALEEDREVEVLDREGLVLIVAPPGD